jgi:hypothetical protein
MKKYMKIHLKNDQKIIFQFKNSLFWVSLQTLLTIEFSAAPTVNLEAVPIAPIQYAVLVELADKLYNPYHSVILYSAKDSPSHRR